MSDLDRDAVEPGSGVLERHVAECVDCQSASPALKPIAALLDADTVSVDAAALSRRVFLCLQPEIARLARRDLWRKVVVALCLALLPLPLVLACDAYVLGVAYQLVSALLPATVAAYLIFGYAAFLVLLFATTYAAIPLFLAGRSTAEEPVFG